MTQVSRRGIAVMAKRPQSGRSKTRLMPHLGADAAAELSSCMISDTVSRLRNRSDCEVFVAVEAPDSLEWAHRRFPGIDVLVQRGNTLGERLDAILDDLLGQGFAAAFAIGSDSPDLPEDHLTTAFDELDTPECDVVFGPTDDGGYYLIGWKQRWSAIVVDVEMSTPKVLADSCAVAASLGAHTVLAPGWYDVDEPADLDRLITSGDPTRMPITAGFLSTLRAP